MAFTDPQCEGCNKVTRLEERVFSINAAQDKMDEMIKSIITLTVKFEEYEKRNERNSRILWGVLTAVIAQGMAFVITLIK